MTGPVAATATWTGRLPEQGSARVELQARRLAAYVEQGGGDPAPQPATLAALAAGPIPLDQLQRVQALLAETRRLAAAVPPPTPAERAARFTSG